MERAAGKAVTNVNQVIHEPCGNAVPQLSHGEFQRTSGLSSRISWMPFFAAILTIALNSYTSISADKAIRLTFVPYS